MEDNNLKKLYTLRKLMRFRDGESCFGTCLLQDLLNKESAPCDISDKDEICVLCFKIAKKLKITNDKYYYNDFVDDRIGKR